MAVYAYESTLTYESTVEYDGVYTPTPTPTTTGAPETPLFIGDRMRHLLARARPWQRGQEHRLLQSAEPAPVAKHESAPQTTAAPIIEAIARHRAVAMPKRTRSREALPPTFDEQLAAVYPVKLPAAEHPAIDVPPLADGAPAKLADHIAAEHLGARVAPKMTQPQIDDEDLMAFLMSLELSGAGAT